jgi:MarR family transcriptional regulator, transcriptional regulator for hemolysin
VNAPASPVPAGAPRALQRDFAFLLSDVARLLRTATDQKAREFGMTRAQWAVLARLERSQGLSQNDLAAILDVQPITLGRLVDKLCQEGLVERRPDPDDRRINRLFLLEAAYPVLERLQAHGAELMGEVLHGIDAASVEGMVTQLSHIKTNLKRGLQCGASRAGGSKRSA